MTNDEIRADIEKRRAALDFARSLHRTHDIDSPQGMVGVAAHIVLKDAIERLEQILEDRAFCAARDATA